MDSIAISNKTARKSNIGGKENIVPRYVATFCCKNATILDFGCGPTMRHVKELKAKGLNFVFGYEFGANVTDECLHGLYPNSFDVVYASSVFNTHSSLSMAASALGDIKDVLCPNGEFIFNFPKPNYLGITVAEFLVLVKQIFGANVTKVAKEGVYSVIKPLTA